MEKHEAAGGVATAGGAGGRPFGFSLNGGAAV